VQNAIKKKILQECAGFYTTAAQLELMQLATGKALVDGFAAAHFKEHAVSLQGHARAHACP